jgi:lipoprotein-releasing system ATP-binding protein
MPEPLIVASGIVKGYRTSAGYVPVLAGLELEVAEGEMVAVTGSSGVGKSTLLHLLGTLDRPTGGRVIFDGEDVSARTDAALARLRRTEVGFIFQFYNLLGEMTALENAMLPALLQRASVPEARERAAAALHEVGLGDRCNRPGGCPGQQRAWRSPARCRPARPSGRRTDRHLDPKTSEVIWDLFLRLQAERHLAFVIATHNHELARKADRGYRLVDGRAVPWP